VSAEARGFEGKRRGGFSFGEIGLGAVGGPMGSAPSDLDQEKKGKLGGGRRGVSQRKSGGKIAERSQCPQALSRQAVVATIAVIRRDHQGHLCVKGRI